MEGLFRRGGVWYARLVIPARLRQAAGRTEFVASTGVREPVLAKVVAAELLAAWRRKLHDFSRLVSGPMNVEQVAVGHPRLIAGGYVSLAEAAQFSGLDEEHLLQEAQDGRLRLYVHAAGVDGWVFPVSALERHVGESGTEIIVPDTNEMAGVNGSRQHFVGVLSIREARATAGLLRGREPVDTFCFDVPDKLGCCFRPANPWWLNERDILVAALDVEVIRKRVAPTISAAHLAIAGSRATLKLPVSVSRMRFSEAIDRYMVVRGARCSADQAKRVKGALELFAELDGDPRLCDVDSARLEHFRDRVLPRVPAHENKVRLQYGTTTVRESIEHIDKIGGQRMSAGEQLKRLKWLRAMFVWLKKKNMIEEDPTELLVDESAASATVEKENGSVASNERRDKFSADDLKILFGTGLWFKTGKGIITKCGTYREFLPYYYWLPLLGLFTGARINEVAQLGLADIRQTGAGVWYVALGALDESGKKRRKNAASRRDVPLHSFLIANGLIEWKMALEAAGYRRLFPELRYDETKGYVLPPTEI